MLGAPDILLRLGKAQRLHSSQSLHSSRDFPLKEVKSLMTNAFILILLRIFYLLLTLVVNTQQLQMTYRKITPVCVLSISKFNSIITVWYSVSNFV